MKFERSSGVLLHPTSLPGSYGIGELGAEAKSFVDFLVESEQKLWQVFPLGHTGYGDSPYQCFSAFAGNPLLISVECLAEAGYIDKSDLKSIETPNTNQVDFGWVIPRKYAILKKAFVNFRKSATIAEKKKIENFKKRNSYWIGDYSLFMSLKDHFGGKSWAEWPEDIRVRQASGIDKYRELLRESIEFYEFLQWIFFDQWFEIKSYANRNYVKIIGDLPIFVAFDSADAWSNPDLFQFDHERRPTHVAGVPPDCFSATGQLWGNPLYDWDKIKADGFRWWVERIKGNVALMDIVRIDHFVGFTNYWSIPASEKTAVNGTWKKALGWEMFEAVKRELGELPIIAEDLGALTADVIKMRDNFEFPGMKILEFAFEGDLSFLPHRCAANCVVYTGTHDNDTCVGWFNNASDSARKSAIEYMNSAGVEIHWDMIRTAWSTHSNISICQAQDLLGLDSESRMNFPGKFGGNWSWRLAPDQLDAKISERLAAVTRIYER